VGAECGVDIAGQTNCRLEKGVDGGRLAAMVESAATCSASYLAGHYRLRQFGGQLRKSSTSR